MGLLLTGCILTSLLCISIWIWRFWSNFLPYIFLLTFVLWLILAIRLFTQSTGDFVWWNINTKVWAEFGSFIGAFLLAATIIFQSIVFRKQQIEAKFFEMIKYYRDNISEMQFRNPFYYIIKEGNDEREFDEKLVEGRRVIKTIFEQYKVGQKLALELIETNLGCIKEINIPKDCLKTLKDDSEKEEWKKNYALNEIAYLLTFWGTPLDIDDELKKYLKEVVDDDVVDMLLKKARKIIAVYECIGDKKEYSSKLKRRIKKGKKLIECKESKGKIKFFGGHQYHLGHYFRHLYQAVGYIDHQPWWLLSKDEKYEYIKTLRAQMSNYEQALLLINSLTKLGRRWEYENEEKRKLISEYNLITNLPETFIPLIRPQKYYPKVDYEWKPILNL